MHWLQKFIRSSHHTKWFILNWIIYGMVLIAATAYAYMRLDYVRTQSKTQTQEMTKS